MNNALKLKDTHSRYHFQFHDAETDADLKRWANLRLAQLLTLAPPDAVLVGSLSRTEKFYVSSVEVKSTFRNFYEKASGTTPNTAIKRVLEKLEDRLYRWRFGGGVDGTPAQASRPLTVPQAQN